MGIELGTRSIDGWSEEQQKILSIVPHVAGGLSILGSFFIMYDVLSDRKKRRSTYHRLLFGMGAYDFVSSFATSLSTVPMPSASGDLSMGNIATCTLQGMFVHINIASPLYNFMLCIYFLLMVTFRWTKDRIKRKVEIWLHGFVFFWVVSTDLVVIIQDGFNDSSLWCWINTSPKGCHMQPSDECERCPHCEYYRWAFFFGPLWIAAFGSIVAMWMLVHSVRKIEEKVAKYRPDQLAASFKIEASADEKSLVQTTENVETSESREIGETSSGNQEETEAAVTEAADIVSSSSSHSNSQNRRTSFMTRWSSIQGIVGRPSPTDDAEERRKATRVTRMVTGRALRYCLVFWITWLPASANRILQLIYGHSFFWVMLLHVIFTPMQGFWNFLVYVELRVRKWIKEKRKYGRAKVSSVYYVSSAVCEPGSGNYSIDDDDDYDYDFDEDNL